MIGGEALKVMVQNNRSTIAQQLLIHRSTPHCSTNRIGTMYRLGPPAGQRQRRWTWSRAALSRMEWPLEELTLTELGKPLASTETRSRKLPCTLALRAEAG